jgi:site-specific recombinase XerC
MNRDTIETVIDTLGDGSQVIMGIGKVQSSDGFYRSFRVGSDCLDAITEYETKERAHDDEPALFVTKQGTRATVSSINADLAGWCKDAGIPPFGSDRFRYTSALEIDT